MNAQAGLRGGTPDAAHGTKARCKQYATMLLRGHSGRVCGCRHYADVTSADVWVLGVAGLALVLAVATRGHA